MRVFQDRIIVGESERLDIVNLRVVCQSGSWNVISQSFFFLFASCGDVVIEFFV